MLRSSGSRARSKLAIVSASSSRAELSSSGRAANSDLRTSPRPAIARSMGDPKNAAAATSFASRVYSRPDQIEHQRRFLAFRQHLTAALAGAVHGPPLPRQAGDLPEVA